MAPRSGVTTGFARLWLTGYVRPIRFVDALATKPSPHWGLLGQLLRATVDAVAVYLPLALMGRVPPTPSYLPFIPTDRYYAALVLLTPAVLIVEMLVACAFLHTALRLLGRRSNFDQIINLVGMAALVVGAVLVPWDWLWIGVGGVDQMFLGLSHLIISLWSMVLTVIGLHRTLAVPVPLAIALTAGSMVVSLPVAIVFMRSPL